MSSRLLLGCAFLLALVTRVESSEPAASAEEGELVDSLVVRFTAGFDYSRGDYGLDRVSTLYYIPLGLTVDVERVRMRIVVPFLVSDGPTAVLPDLAPASGRVRTDRSERSSGLGQIQVSGSYLFDPLSDRLPYLEVGLELTAPSETQRALGTGEWAFAPRVDLFQRYGRLTPFAAVGRKHFTGSELDDRFFTSVGAGFSLAERISVGLAYDWRQAAISGTDDAHELVPYASLPWGEQWRFDPYLAIGLSDGSPDYGIGFTVSVTP